MHRLALLLGHGKEHGLKRMLEVVHRGGTERHDVFILGELAERYHARVRDFKLDAADTTPYELYISLQKRTADDNIRIARAIGIAHENVVSEATPRIVRAVQSKYVDETLFVPKLSALKRIILNNPPRVVMKALHYTSVDSLMKKESVQEIVVLARYLEDQDWQSVHIGLLATLTVRDFELRQPSIIWIDKTILIPLLKELSSVHHYVIHAKEVGCVAVSVTDEKVIYGYTLRTLALLEHYVQELHYTSSYAQTIATGPTFARKYAASLSHAHKGHIHIVEHPVEWASVHKAFFDGPIRDVMPPHMSLIGLNDYSLNDEIETYNDILTWWRGYGHIMWGDQPVSCNLIDNAIDLSMRPDFERRSLKFAQRELSRELYRRYISEPRIGHVVLRQL